MEQAKNDLMPQHNGSMEVLNQEMGTARMQKKLSECNSAEICQALAYCMVLIGLRAENYPSKPEQLIMVNYLLKYFPYTTTEDIRLAFECAVAGKLDLLQSDIKHYENFSCLYLATILRAYKKYFNEVMAEYDRKPVLRALPPVGFDNVSIVDMHYQEFLSDQLNIHTISSRVFEIAVEKCGLTVFEDEYDQFLNQAKLQISDLNVFATALNNTDVESRAQVLCLIAWFQKLKEKGIEKVKASNRTKYA